MGNMGSAHARNILGGSVPGLELVAVADQDASRLETYEDQIKFAEGSELIASGKVEAVIIATPHYDHTTLGIQALEAGLHVLVEKPISVHKADCEKLIAAHTNKDQVFSAMFNQRTVPAYQKLKKLIEDGELGKINRVQWTITTWFRTYHYYASGGWRATWEGEGGGVLMNQCPHQLDLWQWLFGMPESVQAHIELGRFHDIEVEDDVTAYMRYPDGMSGVFITTTGEAPGTNRLEIAAERGKVIVEDKQILWTRNEVETSEHSKTATTGFGKPETWDIVIPADGAGEQHVKIMRNFTNAILHGEELLAPAEEGIHSVELGNAMVQSGLEERKVTLPIDAPAFEATLQDLIKNSTFEKKVVETVASADDFAASN